MMTNFLLEISFSSRLILQTPLMAGDSLLAGILNQRYCGDYERAINDLPIAYVEGVPQMSVMLPYSLASRTVEPVTITRSIMRDMDHDRDMHRLLDRMPSKSDLTPQEGPLGNISSPYQTYDVPKVYFIGCGDLDAVYRIVSDAGFIGSQKNRGFGQVASVHIRPIVSTNPWFGMVGTRDGRNTVLRPIPFRLRDTFPTDLAFLVNNETWHNPYFSGFPNAVVEPCMVPGFTPGESFYEQEIEDDLSRLTE
jgi:hypothetical protein